ncbi:Flp family type IVb pilin [Altererythrobacter sp. Root672]|uniref:Flp family type IVb pilin n=1 Tax=Altererythrobacter sp. Root672 TaxID=1736584 RepID=UPI0009E77E5B|nr:Flp family type IVb pilin [Altererythrobacter sp. Root672]
MKFFNNLLRDEQGATAIEYGLIAALIAVAAMTAMGTIGSELTNTFTSVGDTLENANGA